MLFDGDFYFASGVGGRNYDVSSDGQRFLMMKPVSVSGVATSGRNIEVVLNWSDELIRLVPTH
jgi:hypothetical protein